MNLKDVVQGDQLEFDDGLWEVLRLAPAGDGQSFTLTLGAVGAVVKEKISPAPIMSEEITDELCRQMGEHESHVHQAIKKSLPENWLVG